MMRASIRASVPARSASAVIAAGGMARPGPLRSLRSFAARRTWPVGRADVPVIRASAVTVPSAPTRSAGRLRSDAVRSSVAPARPDTSSTAWRRPSRSLSIVTPVGEADPHRRQQPQRLLSPVGLQRCQVHGLAGGIDLGGGTEPRRRALKVGRGGGEIHIHRIDGTSCGCVQRSAKSADLHPLGVDPGIQGRSCRTPQAWPARCRRSAGRPAAPGRQAASWPHAGCRWGPWSPSAVAAPRPPRGSSRSRARCRSPARRLPAAAPPRVRPARRAVRHCAVIRPLGCPGNPLASMRMVSAPDDMPCAATLPPMSAVMLRSSVVPVTLPVALSWPAKRGSAAARSLTASDHARSTWFAATCPLASNVAARPVNRRRDRVRSLPRSVAARLSRPSSPTSAAGLRLPAGDRDHAIGGDARWCRRRSPRAGSAQGCPATAPDPSPRAAPGRRAAARRPRVAARRSVRPHRR